MELNVDTNLLCLNKFVLPKNNFRSNVSFVGAIIPEGGKHEQTYYVDKLSIAFFFKEILTTIQIVESPEALESEKYSDSTVCMVVKILKVSLKKPTTLLHV